jgi:hypothetical protein
MNSILTILEQLEKNILRTKKTKPIVDAIKNRNKISFFYSGPRKGKESVKAGNRIDAEAVALGLSKKGNLIVRAYVQPPSVSKKGFNKTGWRTFMVSRMDNLKISDKHFDQKRPDYKEGQDNSMNVTYVTTDWTNKPEVKKPRIVKPTPTKPEPTKVEPTKPEVKPTEPQKPELSQPKPTEKPTPTQVEPKLTEPTPPIEKEPEVKQELPQPKPKEKPSVNPEEKPEEEENETLKESIRRIKRLMFS